MRNGQNDALDLALMLVSDMEGEETAHPGCNYALKIGLRMIITKEYVFYETRTFI